MSFLIGEIVDGFVRATTFKAFDLIMPDKALEEEKRYNDAMIALERERLEWDKKQDLLRLELEKAQQEKNEAQESEIHTRIRLNQRPTLKYQPSSKFFSLGKVYGY